MFHVSIPGAIEGPPTFYDIEVIVIVSRLKQHLFKSTKRFSEIYTFRDSLENAVGRAIGKLPSRLANFYKSSSVLVEERKKNLEIFFTSIFADAELSVHPIVLSFFNISRAAVLEAQMVNHTHTHTHVKGEMGTMPVLANTHTIKVDSPQKWMEEYKLLKSLLHDARAKIFSNANVVEIKGNLRIGENGIKLLRSYLLNTKSLNQIELARRKDLVLSLQKEISELTTLLNSSSLSLPKDVATMENSKNLFKTSKGRMLGKAKETDVTRKYDNSELLQLQRQTMHTQDEKLENLHEMIVRQRQMGTAINEELTIQNELLKGLNNHMDNSQQKMKKAKDAIDKIL